MAKNAEHGDRYKELKAMLDERRRVILKEVQGRIRGVREGGLSGKPPDSTEIDEPRPGVVEEDIEFALIQMKAETLNKINEALARLQEGRYGRCLNCGDEIREARLQALPFALRCKDCEEEREIAIQRERRMSIKPPAYK